MKWSRDSGRILSPDQRAGVSTLDNVCGWDVRAAAAVEQQRQKLRQLPAAELQFGGWFWDGGGVWLERPGRCELKEGEGLAMNVTKDAPPAGESSQLHVRRLHAGRDPSLSHTAGLCCRWD